MTDAVPNSIPRHPAQLPEERQQKRLDSFGGDLLLSLKEWPLWTMFGWNDIRQRYRRSILGPLWITLSMGVLIIVLGFIYSHLFKMDLRTYLPYLGLGFIVWGFISASTTESCGAFLDSERIIKQIKTPFSIFVLRVVWRNFIVLVHTIILYVPICIFFGIVPPWSSLLAIPGVALVCINQVWLGIVLGVLSARFRDISQIVATVVQVAIFATPIMWPVSALGPNMFIANINPLYHLIDIVRGPLIGEQPAMLSWLVVLGMNVFGLLTAMVVLRTFSRRLVYWL